MSSKRLRKYIVAPAFNHAAAIKELPAGISHQEKIAAMNAQEKEALLAIQAPVTAIVEKAGGKILVDGSGYGVADHKDQFAAFMLVKVTPATAEEIGKLPDVHISHNGLMHAL